ncbi:hypothetical protein AB6N23_11220 [Cellulomonas sp. 179-A 9B4 NHS]|uniref:hypothetical protein n=1 Tax=Cellulomonas sp. 179-A 9B4 NHS TaxID=3142379 RepID=UPI0039A16375
MEHYQVGPKALRPLMDAFWSPQGWRLPPRIPVGADLDRAVTSGIMFRDPVLRDHDAWVDAARRAAEALTLDEVSDAFVGSLRSRRLDLRSALGSYAVARHLPRHEYEADDEGFLCAVCGMPGLAEPQDVNVLNFERFRWGGVRHDDIRYIAFDLEQFARAPREPVDEAAVALGNRLLEVLRAATPRETATSVRDRLGLIRGNRDERSSLLDILGLCGVLRTAAHPGYMTGFARYDERALPPHHHVERMYPVCWWRGSDGVDALAVSTFLGRLA